MARPGHPFFYEISKDIINEIAVIKTGANMKMMSAVFSYNISFSRFRIEAYDNMHAARNRTIGMTMSLSINMLIVWFTFQNFKTLIN